MEMSEQQVKTDKITEKVSTKTLGSGSKLAQNVQTFK